MVFVMACVLALLVQAAARWVAVLRGMVPVRREEGPEREGTFPALEGAAAPWRAGRPPSPSPVTESPAPGAGPQGPREED